MFAEIQFDVSRAGLRNGVSLSDALNVSRDVSVRDGKLSVSLPQRSAAIFVETALRGRPSHD